MPVKHYKAENDVVIGDRNMTVLCHYATFIQMSGNDSSDYTKNNHGQLKLLRSMKAFLSGKTERWVVATH